VAHELLASFARERVDGVEGKRVGNRVILRTACALDRSVLALDVAFQLNFDRYPLAGRSVDG